jgi:hypothetical protein
MVDLIGPRRVEVTERVVRDGCQMDDCVESPQMLGLHISDIEAERIHTAWFRAQ